MRYPVREPYVANTDWEWFDFLRGHAEQGRVDEVNFWSPGGTGVIKNFEPGEPVFLRLKKPRYAIAGFGFFAASSVLDLRTAWEVFDWKNGAASEEMFFRRIAAVGKLAMSLGDAARLRIRHTILRDVYMWDEADWIPWGEDRGWHDNIVKGRAERTEANARLLWDAMVSHQGVTPAEFTPRFEPFVTDERQLVIAERVLREGQGAFRLRLLKTYSGQCAITGEHTEPVLDAAHIQPYRGPRSNHVQNGLLLTKEFHTLFDRGYVTVTPEHIVRVSPRLHTDWQNGKRYYQYNEQPLKKLPERAADRPSDEALAWHNERVFLRSA